MQLGAEADLRLRDMTPADIAAGQRLSREARWPHRVEDWDVMLKVGHGLVAERGAELVGTIMGWEYGEERATLGMVIVSETCRGRGIGRRLAEAMIDKLAPRAIQLNSTQDGYALYKSLGFEPVGSIHQHQGAAFSAPMPSLRKGERVRPMGQSDRAAVAELDRKATGFERAHLFTALRRHARGVVLDRQGEAVGYALFRRFGHGHLIGPVVAPDREGARTLIAHWLGSKPGIFTRIDVPGDSGLSEWLQELGLEEVDRVETMVRGAPYEHPPAAISFAVASQALG